MGSTGDPPVPVGDSPTGRARRPLPQGPSLLPSVALPVPPGESPGGTGQWPTGVEIGESSAALSPIESASTRRSAGCAVPSPRGRARVRGKAVCNCQGLGALPGVELCFPSLSVVDFIGSSQARWFARRFFPLTPALSPRRGRTVRRAFANPERFDSSQRGMRCSLSLRERARVRGNATPPTKTAGRTLPAQLDRLTGSLACAIQKQI